MNKLLADEPTLLCLMSRLKLVKQIGDTIAACDPPTVVGVHGDWGSGKTSFLHQLQYYLSGECHASDQGVPKNLRDQDWPGWEEDHAEHCAVIWFEAWRYQHEAAPIVALLHEIRAQLPMASKLFNAGKKWATIAVKAALVNLENITGKIGGQAAKVVSSLGEQHKSWQKEHLAEQLPSHTLREYLQQAIEQLLPKPDNKPKPRIIVLIDDLDRCEPQTAYRLLEGIKIYLNLPNCVFVLGVNQASIEASLAEQLAKEKAEQPSASAKLRAREYLDKICRNFWHLPAFNDIEYLINSWLNLAIPDAAIRDQPETGFYARLLGKNNYLPNNPRRIKGFVNTLARFIVQASPRGIDPPTGKMCAILAYLYHFHPDIYQRIDLFPEFYDRLREWCGTPKPSAPKHELLDDLARMDDLQTNATSTAATRTSNLTYPNLNRANTFHIQLLIRDSLEITQPLLKACLLK